MLSQSWIITTAVVTGERGFAGEGGPAERALLNGPFDVGFDTDGNLYFSDTFNHHIRRVDAQTGIITTCAGSGEAGYSGDGGPATAARLNEPYGIAIDKAANVYIADRHNHCVRRVEGASGVISFGTAGGLAADLAPGTLVVAERIDGPFGSTAADAGWAGRIASRLAQSGARFPVRLGTLAAVDEPVIDAHAKRALNLKSGALAVDMESHLAAAMAADRGLPFVACRVVVDPAWRSLPPAATVGLRADGSTALMPILAELARAPGQLPDMLRLAADAHAARKTLIAARRVLGDGFCRTS